MYTFKFTGAGVPAPLARRGLISRTPLAVQARPTAMEKADPGPAPKTDIVSVRLLRLLPAEIFYLPPSS